MDYSQAKLLARDLRKNMTKAEKSLWHKIRMRKLSNLRFNRQFPISYKILDSTKNWFIIDFYCHEMKLIIEIDGKIHEKRKEYDLERDEILSAMGFHILHLTNEEVLENWPATENKILHFIKNIP